MQVRRAALALIVACWSTLAVAESGAVNIHLEPGAAFPVNDPLQTPTGQGVALKVDVPVWENLAVQLVGDAVSFKSGQYLRPGTALGGGVGVRYRILNDQRGYLVHLGENAEGHEGNLFGNVWVDGNLHFLGGSGQVRTAGSVGLGAEASLLDGLQLGPFVKYQYVGPEQMVMVGLSLSVGVPDTSVHDEDFDKDGIVNAKDKCPRKPEDKDGFEDGDGCPDDDNDDDEIKDVSDACPVEPEDKDGFQDEDGCPDPDNDGDGIEDGADKCPLEAEDKDGFQDEDGCPDPDNDGDGIEDAADKCPLEAEDKDGFQDEDGCPDLDNDADGIPDATDKCPNRAEDKDGFQDEDGCPDLDNDQDGVPDTTDKCPDKPETRDGIDDEDGCPEEKAKVFVEQHKVVITEKIFFQFNKAKILAKSFGLLDSVAQVLGKFPELKKVRIEGHTDDVGNAAYNQKLSEQRAQAVRDYLVKKGVAAERLEAVGYGKSRPLAEGKDEASREQNRRVEFTIVEPADGIVPVVIDPNAPPDEGAAIPADEAQPATDGGVPAPQPAEAPAGPDAGSPDAGSPDAGTP